MKKDKGLGKRDKPTAKIGKWIETKLVRRLKNDQENLKILSEGDLQSSVYYHLRKSCIKDEPRWHLLNKLFIKEAKVYPDIAIAYLSDDGEKVYPKILIEIKETIGPLSPKSLSGYKKDFRKLDSLIDKEGKIRKAYFILGVLPNPKIGEATSKKSPFFDTTEIEETIEKMRKENKFSPKIKPIIINAAPTEFHAYSRFRKKHRLLRKYRGKEED